MKRLSVVVFILIAALVGSSAAAAASSPQDLARKAFDMMAGPAWNDARYLEFSFVVEREGKVAASYAQRWDRFTGAYRVEGKNREGKAFVVVMNVNDKTGKAWVDGALAEDPAPWLTLGYRRFINDTYWLQMPLKMLDPGVHLEAAGERTDACGNAWDVVKLSFDAGVGLTPADQYWAWVNRVTGLVDYWEMLLTGAKPDEAPTKVVFLDWKRVGGLLISTRRLMNETVIRLDGVRVLAAVPDGAFSDPQ